MITGIMYNFGAGVGTVPGVYDVRAGIAYGIADALTGTLLVPTAEADDALTAAQQAAINDILLRFGEPINVYRKTVEYDSVGRAAVTWVLVYTVALARWRPVSADTIRSEVGLEVKSKSQVMFPHDIVLMEDDKVVRADGTFLYVNYDKPFLGHVTAYLKGAESMKDA